MKFRILRYSILFGMATGILLSVPTTSYAYQEVFETECFYADYKNSAPIWAKNGCEIKYFMAQGFYSFEMTFTSRTKFVAGGDYNAGTANLDRKKASMRIDQGFTCWESLRPYKKVCIKKTIDQLTKDYVDRMTDAPALSVGISKKTTAATTSGVKLYTPNEKVPDGAVRMLPNGEVRINRNGMWHLLRNNKNQ